MELEIIKGIQTIANGFWDVVFQGITMFGEEIVVLLVVLAFYFVINKKVGIQLAFVLFVSSLVNFSIKDWLQLDRPIGQPGIRSLRVETAGGYSFPSNHTQTAAAMAFFIAKWKGGKKAFVLATLFAFLVGVSRLYLGVHYPKDVLVGLALGLLIAIGLTNFMWLLNRPQVLYMLGLVVFLPGVVLNGSPAYLHIYGLLWGMVLAAYLEERFVGFRTDGRLGRRMFRYLLSIVLVAALYILCGYLPNMLLFDFLSYFILTFAVMFLYPWVLHKIGL